jgi:hypothetical protein
MTRRLLPNTRCTTGLVITFASSPGQIVPCGSQHRNVVTCAGCPNGYPASNRHTPICQLVAASLKHNCIRSYCLRRNTLQTGPCRDRLTPANRDMPGQGTGRSQSHLSSYLECPWRGTGECVRQTGIGATHMAGHWTNTRRKH